MKNLFGTDGIRGITGKPPLTQADALKIGRAAGCVLKQNRKAKSPQRVVIVRDTRASGLFLVQKLAQGLREEGIDVFDAGILCTPAVAFLVRAHRLQSGVVVSASHNPPEFNGIKFFNHEGRKWPDSWEQAIEKIFFSSSRSKKGKSRNSTQGKLIQAKSFGEDYKVFLTKTLPSHFNLSGFRIATDSSNGANSFVAQEVLAHFGAKVFPLGNKPTGQNINVNCGSQHTAKLGQAVRKNRCHVGIAFDGDGDRVIFTDHKGHEIDGDFIMGLLAKWWKKNKKLKNKKVVLTVMSNLGLRVGLARLGIKTIETQVGDRYVSEAMLAHRANLGGEQSGHIILGDYLPSGDGLLTALHVLCVLKESKKSLSSMAGWMSKFPQVLLNVPVKEKKPIPQLNGVQTKIKQIEKILGAHGRVLVRYSGTEPLLRIMLEGPDKKKIEQYAHEIKKEVLSSSH